MGKVQSTARSPTSQTREQINVSLRIDGQFQVEPKGVTRSLLVLEIGGIGEPFNLSLPARSSAGADAAVVPSESR
jgi:hypothetical protein